MERLKEALDAMDSTLEGTRWLGSACEGLGNMLHGVGTKISEEFETVKLSNIDTDEKKPVTELLVAWREVGEAQVVLATKLRDLGASLQQQLLKGESERKQREKEASRLHQMLNPPPKVGKRGWFGFGASKAPDEDEMKQKLESQRVAANACIEHLVTQLEAARTRDRTVLLDACAEMRRLAKDLGEKLCLLRPSWRGAGPARARTSVNNGQVSATPPTVTTRGELASQSSALLPKRTSGGSGRVEDLIKTIATAESRQRHADAESAKEALQKGLGAVVVQETAPLKSPPIEKLSKDTWRIKGVYDHQVLKVGLRLLDEAWNSSGEGLDDFPRKKDGTPLLFRESLMRDLLIGKVRLQSVVGNDVSAAQNDVKQLSLKQLLRLRVLHLDFTPSGCGADSISVVGGTHEAFLSTLDGLLFQNLGRQAGTAVVVDGGSSSVSDLHRFGREAILFVAAAAAASATPWWVWWPMEDRRIYFNVDNFTSVADFAASGKRGVFEITDYSKSDVNDPTKRLKWFEWQLQLIKDEHLLSAEPLRGAGVMPSSFSEKGPSKKNSSATGLDDKASAPAFSGGALSADTLKSVRSSLRKTEYSPP